MEFSVHDKISEIAEGNPGAINAAVRMLNMTQTLGETALEIAKKYGITGENLYLLWKDCFNRNDACTLLALVFCSKGFLRKIAVVWPETGFGEFATHITITLDGAGPRYHYPRIEEECSWDDRPVKKAGGVFRFDREDDLENNDADEIFSD